MPELVATTLLKYSAGFTKLYPTIGCLIAYFLCFFQFSKALNSINLGLLNRGYISNENRDGNK